MDFRGKKLLILGGASLHKKFVETAHELGITTIVVDNVKDSPAKLISDISYDINVTEIDELEKICKSEKVDAIISGYLDFCQRYYQQLCERMGLYCYGTFEQFNILTNKELFKQKCMENNIDIVPSYEEEMFLGEKKTAKAEYPVYVKPSYSRGSRGQKICYSFEEAKNAVEKAIEISEDNHAIIEKYMGDNDIIQVSYIVIDGEPYLIRTVDQYNGIIKDGMDHICIAAVSPSVYTNMYFDKVNENVKKMIKNLNIKNAPFFMQGFIDGDTVRFFDPGLRFPGTEYSRLLKKATNLDTAKALIEFAFTGEIKETIKDIDEKDIVYMNGKYITNLFPSILPGKIKSITSKDDMLKLDGVEYISYRKNVGDVVAFTGDVNQRIAEVNLYADNMEEMEIAIENVNKNLIVLNDEDENMIFSKFTLNMLRN